MVGKDKVSQSERNQQEKLILCVGKEKAKKIKEFMQLSGLGRARTVMSFTR